MWLLQAGHPCGGGGLPFCPRGPGSQSSPAASLGGIQETAGPLGGLGLCSQWGRGHREGIGGGSWRPEWGLLCWPVFLGNPLESLWAPRKGGAGRWPLVPSGGAEPGWPLGEGRAASLQRDSEVARNRHPGMWCTRRSQALQTWRRVLGERAPPGRSQTRGAVTVELGRQQNPSVWHPEVLGAPWPERALRQCGGAQETRVPCSEQLCCIWDPGASARLGSLPSRCAEGSGPALDSTSRLQVAGVGGTQLHHTRPLPDLDLLEVLSDVDEMSRRRPEILGFFSVRSSHGPQGAGTGGTATPTPLPVGAGCLAGQPGTEAAQQGGAGLGEWGPRLRLLRGEPRREVAC